MRSSLSLLISGTLVLIASSVCWAQSERTTEAHVKLISKYDGKRIKLRWAPDAPHAWRLLSKQGYVIERYTVVENGLPIAGKPHKKVLTLEPILPWPEDKWEAIGSNNAHVAMAYQALIAPQESTFGQTNGLAQVTDLNRAERSSFGYALYAADVEPLAAAALGLAFVDEQVTPRSQYTYIVRPAIEEETYPIAQASVSVETYQATTLPAIETIKVISLDKMVRLAVDVSTLKNRYTAYQIEKKEAYIEQFRAMDRPMQVHLDARGKPLNWMEIADTLTRNNYPVWYRIRGIDAFGDPGPYSEVIQTQGRDLFDGGLAPAIDTLSSADNQNILLRWSFAEATTAVKIDLVRASTIQGPYGLLKSWPNPLQQGTFTDSHPSGANYYKVIAYDASGKKAESYPGFFQLEDNTPPQAPQGLTGEINQEGQVTLTWRANAESDLLGYRVFTSNTPQGEWIELTHDVSRENSLTYHIPLDNLTPKIFYRVQAMDQRFNQSDYSTTVPLTKPDLLPPVPAQIKDYQTTPTQVRLTLRKSSSHDVAQYELQMIQNEQTSLLATWSADDLPPTYTLPVTSGAQLGLLLTTQDKQGNQAKGETIHLSIPSTIQTDQKALKAQAHPDQNYIVIDWENMKASTTQQWHLYKAVNEGPFRLYQMLEADTHRYQDYFLKTNNTYRYKLKSVDPTSATQTWSNEVELTYGK